MSIKSNNGVRTIRYSCVYVEHYFKAMRDINFMISVDPISGYFKTTWF